MVPLYLAALSPHGLYLNTNTSNEYLQEQIAGLPKYTEEEEETTELEINVKDYLAEWRHIVDI